MRKASGPPATKYIFVSTALMVNVFGVSAFVFRAANVAVDNGLLAPDLLLASLSPTMDLVIPNPGPVNVMVPIRAAFFESAFFENSPTLYSTEFYPRCKTVYRHTHI